MQGQEFYCSVVCISKNLKRKMDKWIALYLHKGVRRAGNVSVLLTHIIRDNSHKLDFGDKDRVFAVLNPSPKM